MTFSTDTPRERAPRNKGIVVVVVVLFGLAALGIISTAILITLAVTGQIG
jgi:hypothetical protein